jgi:hypothetical protein
VEICGQGHGMGIGFAQNREHRRTNGLLLHKVHHRRIELTLSRKALKPVFAVA